MERRDYISKTEVQEMNDNNGDAVLPFLLLGSSQGLYSKLYCFFIMWISHDNILF